jgi:hypothetical protein
MQDQGNNREDQQQVNKATGYMKDGEAANPSDQKNHKQDCPDTHDFSPLLFFRRYATRFPYTDLALVEHQG